MNSPYTTTYMLGRMIEDGMQVSFQKLTNKGNPVRCRVIRRDGEDCWQTASTLSAVIEAVYAELYDEPQEQHNEG